jgi:hypothetical protein
LKQPLPTRLSLFFGRLEDQTISGLGPFSSLFCCYGVRGARQLRRLFVTVGFRLRIISKGPMRHWRGESDCTRYGEVD